MVVAEGHNMLVKFSGTVKNDAIILWLTDVLYIPNLERRLFSLMSLIDQNHNVKLYQHNGVQIYLYWQQFPTSINMPNYHLFASSTHTKQKSTSTQPLIRSNMKANAPLELCYMQMGCRNIKTHLSSNQKGL